MKGEHQIEIHKQIVAVYGDVMNQQNVMKWCREFFEGKTDVHDKQRSSRPSVISDDLQKIEGEIHANQCRMIRELYHIIPKECKITIHEAVTEKLGYRKLFTHWVLRDYRWRMASLFVVNISIFFGEFTAPLCHILPIHNVTISSNNLFLNFCWTFIFALRNCMTERTLHLVGLWISTAISNTSYSNKAGSTTAKQARLTGKGSRSTALLSH
jgi:hypothetical protein